MTEQKADEAAQAHVRAVVVGDASRMVRDMTPEALAKAMKIGNTTWNFLGYELTSEEWDGDDYVFEVAYETDLGDLKMRQRLRLVDGAWKIVDVERI